MAEKIFNTRILNKIDTLEAWNSSSLKLKKGEIALCTVAASAGTGLTEPVVMAKIGTAEEKTFSELPWSFYAKASDVLAACKTEAGLKEFVNNVIADAGIASSDAMEALSGRVTTAEGKITTLEGEMDAVEAKAAANETAIAGVKGLVGDTAVATQISNAIAALDLENTYAAKVHGHEIADVNGLQAAIDNAKKAGTDASAALDTYKTANDAAVKANTDAIAAIKDSAAIDSFADVETELGKKEAAGAAATALTDAKAYADGLAKNYDAAGSAAAAETAAKAYADGLATNYDAAGAAAGVQTNLDAEVERATAAEAKALTDAKGYTDERITAMVGDTAVGTQITNAITGLKLADTYAAKVHTHAIDDVTGLQDALDGKQAAGDYATKAEAQAMADGKDEAIAAAKKAGDDAQADVDALETYVGIIPEGYTETNVVAYINKKAEETLNAASGGSSESAASVLAALNTYKTENDPKVTANTEAIADLQDLVGEKSVSEQIAAETSRATGVEAGLENRLKAVEDDYLKAADKTELDGKITANANAIELLTNGVSAEEVDGVNDLIQYVKDHGTEVTGMKADIKANTDAVAAEKTRAEGVESGLDSRLATVEAAIGDEGAVAADIAAALAEAKGYTDTEVNELADGAVATNASDIAGLKEKVGDTAVATQITNAVDGLKNGELATMQGEIDTLGEADGQINEEIDTLKARMDAAEADIDTLEEEVAKKANDADLAAIAKTGNVNDLVQTEGDVIIFDCGGAV